MRRVCAFVAFFLALPVCSSAAGDRTATVAVTVQVAARTSLRVSTEMLAFALDDDGGAATATVDFVAGARVPSGSGLVLSVEPLRALEGPGGAADVDGAITFDGDGAGTRAGALTTAHPSVAGRWEGSGRRSGRLTFTLRATAAGVYTIPVRFVLSTP